MWGSEEKFTILLKSLYILDKPTIGLSFYDVVKLMELLDQLVREGNSAVIIEHDPEILSYTDYIIELGPEGGPNGGKVIATGTAEEIKKNIKSKTGPYYNSIYRDFCEVVILQLKFIYKNHPIGYLIILVYNINIQAQLVSHGMT